MLYNIYIVLHSHCCIENNVRATLLLILVFTNKCWLRWTDDTLGSQSKYAPATTHRSALASIHKYRTVFARNQDVDDRAESETFAGFSFYQGEADRFSKYFVAVYLLRILRIFAKSVYHSQVIALDFIIFRRSNSFHYIIYLLFCEKLREINKCT